MLLLLVRGFCYGSEDWVVLDFVMVSKIGWFLDFVLILKIGFVFP